MDALGAESLRSLAFHLYGDFKKAPYFQNGSVQKLSDAIRIMAVCELNKTLTDGQVRDISAFMSSLTGKFPKEILPHEPQTPDTTIMMHVAKLEKTAEEAKAQ